MKPSRITRSRQQGLSIVEMMVGIAVGLFIIAAATMIVTTQLADNRLLLLQTQLQQDLRATSDIITRELRRAGSVGSTSLAQEGIWQNSAIATIENPFTDVEPAEDGETTDSVTFSYRRGSGNEGPFGFMLEGGVIKSLIGGVYQELTDAQVMRVTAFEVTPLPAQVTQIPCPRDCPGGSTDCWPTLTVRSLAVSITAESRADSSIVRTIRSQVRLRNEWVKFNDPGPGAQACPA